jgi:hypothetical protein
MENILLRRKFFLWARQTHCHVDTRKNLPAVGVV